MSLGELYKFYNGQCVCLQGELVQPAGLPVDDLLPAADTMLDVHVPVFLGSEDGSEHSLDIGSATRGNRIVSTSQV